MLHSEARAKSERSIHSIMDNTRVIDVIEPRSLFPDTVEVRRMLSRTHKESQHFIVTLFSDIQRAQDTQVVKPLAELAIRGDKLRFTVKPTKQYPNLRMTDEIISLIEKSVDRFMKSTFSTKILISDDKKQGIRKEWHQL
ncbi:hypothetical protein RM153_23355 (plasmid) [Pantoea agglomerans]|uniref:hypothetical protein n=1 Tax=Enterobacter agglomerans TaxID=549 RepID=UPI0028982205|nr:hypothetical protein [Pantoea agglomerans]WNK51572.1 hypothetical protein RM153_23355 [Pantoea agglomerans]